MKERDVCEPEPVISYVKDGLVDHVTLLFGPPFGEVHRDGAVWVFTGDPDPYRNGVLDADVDPEDGDELSRLLEPFRRRGQAMMWWFFTAESRLDPRLHSALLDRGLFLESDRPAMTLDLGALEAAPARPHGLDIRRVQDEKDFRAWLPVVADAFSTPDRETSLSTRSFLRWGFGSDSPFHHYVSFLNGVAVAGATFTFSGDLVSLGNIATRRSFQKRGIALATVFHGLADAAARGARIASLSADPAGTRLYTKLGFQTVGRHLTYVWKP